MGSRCPTSPSARLWPGRCRPQPKLRLPWRPLPALHTDHGDAAADDQQDAKTETGCLDHTHGMGKAETVGGASAPRE